jgi:histidinol-phosphate phosphatase family protein
VTAPALAPGVFLDRDGTIIVERHYLSDPAAVELLPGAARALHRLRQAGHRLAVISNQSGIARGLYDEAAYRAVQARLEALLAAEGVTIDGAWFCPHHPEFSGTCDCRKPGTSLFRQAADTLGIDFQRAFFIGDRLTDVTPAFTLGGDAILVRTGYGAAESAKAPPGVRIVADLGAAANLVLGPEAAG